MYRLLFLSVNGDVISTNMARVLLTADDDCATSGEKYEALNKQTERTALVSDEPDCRAPLRIV